MSNSLLLGEDGLKGFSSHIAKLYRNIETRLIQDLDEVPTKEVGGVPKLF